MSETNGNGFPLSMKVAYAKDLMVANIASNASEAVEIIEALTHAFSFQGVPQPEKIQGAGPYKPTPKPTPTAAVDPESSSSTGPDLHSDVVTVKAWAKEPKTGAKKNGKGSWWKLGVKVHFPSLKLDDWLVVWSPKKAAYLQERQNKQVPITYSVDSYNGKPQYTLEGIDGMEE